MPTASRSSGLGNGDTDLGAVLIGTRRFGRLELEMNADHVFTDIARGRWSENEWLFGLAGRHEVGERWIVFGETYAWIAAGEAAAPPRFTSAEPLQYAKAIALS